MNQNLHLFLILGVAVLAAFALHGLLFRVLLFLQRKNHSIGIAAFMRHGRNPLLLLMPVLALLGSLPVAKVSADIGPVAQHALSIAAITGIGWLLAGMMRVLEILLLSRFPTAAGDNLEARKVQTQAGVLRRALVAGIWLITISAMLMTFDKVRLVGLNILASAGIAGIVLGFAAQRTLGSLMAGLQIALTQPIRLDDVVIVENEWGRIEEITLTYVVVRIWDERRLVLPITYFTERPFQNWTRTSADILATVFLYADYTVPVEAVRLKLRKLLEASPLWDGRVCGLQVTGLSEQAMELRALMSAADASKAWDLRCEIREQLIAFIRTEYADGLPRSRVQLQEPHQVRSESKSAQQKTGIAVIQSDSNGLLY